MRQAAIQIFGAVVFAMLEADDAVDLRRQVTERVGEVRNLRAGRAVAKAPRHDMPSYLIRWSRRVVHVVIY